MLPKKPEDRKHVILFWEWTSPRGDGVLSTATLGGEVRGRLHQLLDRIEELERLTHDTIAGRIFPFRGPLKKLKIRGRIAFRPILVLGPYDTEKEITFLVSAREVNRVLQPSSREVAKLANTRLEEVQKDPKRRKRYER
jgi:hypothetical protein